MALAYQPRYDDDMGRFIEENKARSRMSGGSDTALRNRGQKQQEQNGIRLRQITPQGGLSIPTQAERKAIEEAKKRAYRDELVKQQKDQWLIRAQQEGDIPIIDRRYPQNTENRNPPAFLRDSFGEGQQPEQIERLDLREVQQPQRNDPGQFIHPPPGPANTNYAQPEGGRQYDVLQVGRPNPGETQISPEQVQGQMFSEESGGQSNFKAFTDSEERNMEHKRHIGDIRRHDYQEFLAKKEKAEQEKREHFQPREHEVAEPVKNEWYNAEEYQKRKSQLNSERQREYNDFISKARQRANQHPRHDPLVVEEKPPIFMNNMGGYERERQLINEQRQKDYNRFLDQKYTYRDGKPRGRPDFVKKKEIQDNTDQRLAPEAHHYYRNQGPPQHRPQTPPQAASPVSQTYAELLQQKRRQEARLRQNDPVYHRPEEIPMMRQSPASYPRTEALY
ncbi:hypothetical protein ScPMuIL_006820 [Solemya velum]